MELSGLTQTPTKKPRKGVPDRAGKGVPGQAGCTNLAFVSPDVDDGETGENNGITSTSENRLIREQNLSASWDIFPHRPSKWKQFDKDSFWTAAEKVATAIFIVLLFCIVLGTGLISRITLHLLIWHIHPPSSTSDNTNRTNNGINSSAQIIDISKTQTRSIDEKWIWSIFLVIIAPYILTVLSCLRTIALRKTRSIWYGPLLLNLVIETLHSTTLICLVYIVLSVFNPPTSSVIYLAVTFALPLIELSHTKRRGVCRTIVVIFEMLLELAAIILTCMYIITKSSSIDEITYAVVFVLSSIILSTKYWENFTDVSKTAKNMQYLKWINQTRRTKILFITNLWKIVISFITVVVIFGIESRSFLDGINAIFNFDETTLKPEFSSLAFGSTDSCKAFVPFVIAVINICSSYVCTKAAKTACVIGFQIICFSLPLIIVPLATPFALAGIMYRPAMLNFTDCDLLFSYFDLEPVGGISDVWWIVVSGLMFYISVVLTTCYVWTTQGFKLGKLQRLFITPPYCGIHTELSLLLNRKRCDEEYDTIIQMERNETGKYSESQKEERCQAAALPMIYACATMWHETEKEMTQLLKSLFRMDKHQHALKTARKQAFTASDVIDYDFEAHIFFDDAFEEGTHCSTVNDYVKTLCGVIDIAASEILRTPIRLGEPEITNTPFGGRLQWTMPGGNALVVHLKDKSKIRHRKRWSQVMYMYYFLGYNLGQMETDISKTINKASRTYLLALDGDVDFKPEAVMHLVRRMKKNPCVGAACGRIHPIGNGPMVWYQKFEYAVSHWLQKATEHVTGCVLCSPGCFSLFRGSALIGVLKTYTTKATAAKHFIQYDQGEDRWLCTLLLKDGYRVEYCAESDSYTFAPEGFYEFYNQRRRWSPSTMGNILDLLLNWKQVVSENNSISRLFMLYQLFLFISSLLTPGTIFLMIVGAVITAFPSIPVWLSLTLNVIPVGLFLLSCVLVKSEVQLLFAGILSAVYSITMVLVLIGIIKVAAEDGLCSTTTIFLCFVAGVFALSALLHPKEASNIVHGILYFLCIPSMSMLLMLYSLGNLHVVSWGTREVKRQENQGSGQKERQAHGKEEGYMFSVGHLFRCVFCPAKTVSKEDLMFQRVLERLDAIEKATTGNNDQHTVVNDNNEQQTVANDNEQQTVAKEHVNITVDAENTGTISVDNSGKHKQPEMMSQRLDFQNADNLSTEEETFWKQVIKKHLKPLDKDETQEKRIQDDLIALRNKCCLFFFLLNTFLVTLVYSLTQVSAYAGSLNIYVSCTGSSFPIEPISITFTVVFGILLVIQFLCLLLHRISTWIHIAAATTFKNDRDDYSDLLTSLEVLQRCDSSSSLRSESSHLTEDYGYTFGNRKQKKLKNQCKFVNQQMKLDEIVRHNLNKLKTDNIEGPSDGVDGAWSTRYNNLNVKSRDEKKALRNSFSILQTLDISK